MPRIRTIKPEFPHSESMGRISRDARLTFILLWTLADDEGRLRGSSRMLASLLFPYDDDAPKKMDGWLRELEGQSCVIRYLVDNDSYIQICNWLIHQKIDRPSASKIPTYDEHSRSFASIREDSPLDQGSRIKDQGPRIRDQGSGTRASAAKTAIPEGFGISEAVKVWAYKNGLNNLDSHLESFINKCKANGYKYSDWDAAFRNAIKDNWARIQEEPDYSKIGD